MKSRIVEVSIYNTTEYEEYVSLTGKLWVKEVQYDEKLDNLLIDNEEILLDSYGINIYVYKENDRRIVIRRPSFCMNLSQSEAVNSLRALARTLLKKFPHFKTIGVDNDGIYTLENATPKYIELDTLNRKYSRIILLSNGEKENNYEKLYKKLDSLLSQIGNDFCCQNPVYVFDNYALVTGITRRLKLFCHMCIFENSQKLYMLS